MARKLTLKSALLAAVSAKVPIRAIETRADGGFRILTTDSSLAESSPTSALEAWERRRDRRDP